MAAGTGAVGCAEALVAGNVAATATVAVRATVARARADAEEGAPVEKENSEAAEAAVGKVAAVEKVDMAVMAKVARAEAPRFGRIGTRCPEKAWHCPGTVRHSIQ